jgi:uncharacterized protein (UPF0332 family)
MTAWQPGREIIATLIDRKHLERISGEAANGDHLLRQARERLAGARAAMDADRVGAFVLAYDSMRQAVTAVLVQQGLRPRVEGGHVAVAQAVEAQFGSSFKSFNSMRRIRNQLEYPRSTADLDLGAADVQRALAQSEAMIGAVERLLPDLGIWHP